MVLKVLDRDLTSRIMGLYLYLERVIPNIYNYIYVQEYY